MIIVIEGIDGCGKTTICNALKSHFKAPRRQVLMFSEPYGHFGEYVRKSQCSEAQKWTLALTGRCEIWEKIKPLRKDTRNIIILDRSYQSSWAYQKCMYRLEYNVFTNLHQVLLAPNYRNAISFFIDTCPEVCRNRIKQRGALDKNEKKYCKKYEEIRSRYLDIFAQEKFLGLNANIIDGNRHFKHILKEIIDIISKNLIPQKK